MVWPTLASRTTKEQNRTDKIVHCSLRRGFSRRLSLDFGVT